MTEISEFHSISCRNEGEEINDPSPLQKHVMFFDMNKDGVVYPWETFRDLREIGCGILLSVFLSIFINFGSSRKSRPGKGFSPFLPVEIENISKAKHGSDTGVYDKEGRFVPEKFEEIFEKHACTNKTSLTSDELSEMLKDNRDRNDYFGWVAAYVEWKVLYSLCKDKQGLLHRETIRAVFDGSLFEKMAKDHKASMKQA